MGVDPQTRKSWPAAESIRTAMIKSVKHGYRCKDAMYVSPVRHTAGQTGKFARVWTLQISTMSRTRATRPAAGSGYFKEP